MVVDPTLNAFAGPAGYIYFHTGLILAAGSLDELAGVMAHEIAHAKRSHVARSIEKATIPDLLAKLLGVGVAVAADEPGALIAAEGVSQSLQLAYSRELEAEADEVGVAFLVRAGYDPMGMATLLRAPRRAEAARARLRGAALSRRAIRASRRASTPPWSARAARRVPGARRSAPARGLPRAPGAPGSRARQRPHHAARADIPRPTRA